MQHVRIYETVHTNPPCTKEEKMPHVKIFRTLGTNRAGAKEGKMPHVRMCRTCNRNRPGTKDSKMPHVRICRSADTIRRGGISADHLMPPCGHQAWQNPMDCCSNFDIGEMKHDKIDDDEIHDKMRAMTLT